MLINAYLVPLCELCDTIFNKKFIALVIRINLAILKELCVLHYGVEIHVFLKKTGSFNFLNIILEIRLSKLVCICQRKYEKLRNG